MPGGKERLGKRLTGGLYVTSGSVAAQMKEIWAGSVAFESPSFGSGSLTGSTAAVSITVTGLNASMVIFATPASIQAGPIALRSACAIADKIETSWIHTGSAAVSTCQVTLQYFAVQT